MPWPRGHKTRTRERIVKAAAAAFRARGVAGVRVEDVMADAGLTHGGFYAHFASKDALLGPVLRHASDQTLESLSSGPATPDGEHRFRAVFDAYLSPEHAAHPERGCPVAALGPEIARSGGRPRRELARGIEDRLAWMRQLLPESWHGEQREDEVIGALACMVGGVILGRAVGGKESDELLAACRRFLHRTLDKDARGTAPRDFGGGR
ncbi:MAG TPA: TetR/AcrR family transcriptional regulator [Anaeromyxobacter sp.]